MHLEPSVPHTTHCLTQCQEHGYTHMFVLGARRVRAAALFCPPVEEPEREAGPAAMGHPPWGSEHGLYVVVVNAGGAPKGRERSNPRRYMGLEVHTAEHAGLPRTHRR